MNPEIRTREVEHGGVAPTFGQAQEKAMPAAEQLAVQIGRLRERAEIVHRNAVCLQALLDHLPRVLSGDAEEGLLQLMRKAGL